MNLLCPENPKDSELLIWVVDLDEPSCPRCSLPMSWCECHDMKDDPPEMTPRERAWREGTQRARERIQASILVHGEEYVGMAEASTLTGYSLSHLRLWMKDGTLKQRGVKTITCPRSDTDQRPPSYLRKCDLHKIKKG